MERVEARLIRKGNRKMRLQSTIFCDDVCNEEKMYFRKRGRVEVNDNKLYIKKDSSVTTKTYLNLFDMDVWNRYTGMESWRLRLILSGVGKICLFLWTKNEERKMQEIEFNTENEMRELTVLFNYRLKGFLGGKIYYKVEAYSDVVITEAGYYTALIERRVIYISHIICTYHRKEQLLNNIKKLENSEFYNPKSILYKRMQVIVIDNASELEERTDHNIFLLHNSNTGGSGGFLRGIKEVRKRTGFGTTNVIFMDDDVEFMMESFYRLFALLSYLKEEYQKEVIAGRMFRMDKKGIQYTAVEIWNEGHLIHIGKNMDMTETNHLLEMNDLIGEYSGWWFACFPMGFVKENDPLPFFLHCDDVEYGLRHGGSPIVLNGIQVWHETYEYRQSPIIKYYDTRNSLFVNEYYGLRNDKAIIFQEWKAAISESHLSKDWITEYMIIQGFLDYMKGLSWLKKINSEIYHKYMLKQKGMKWRNAILWRYAAIKFKGKYKEK